MSRKTAARPWQPNSNSKVRHLHHNLAAALADVKTVAALVDAKNVADLVAGKIVAATATVHRASTMAAAARLADQAADPAQEQVLVLDHARMREYSMRSTWSSCA